ncbi:MAG: hypothetical protein OXQ84_22415 [bacterium]|nr:hypothetical protein [bacterium]
MPVLSGTRSLANATLAGFDAIILAFICDLRRRAELAETLFCKYRLVARHFLIWLELAGIEIRSADATIIDRFLQHDCRCEASCRPFYIRHWRKRRRSRAHGVHPVP